MSYRIGLAPPAIRALQRLRPLDRLTAQGVIDTLGRDPRPPHCRPVAGTDLLRIRFRLDGVPWRIVYQVRDAERLVVVTRVAKRNEATYRGL